MKTLRWMMPMLGVVALVSAGCIITSAQILTYYELTNPFEINSSTTDHSELVPVDLNTISEYADNKDKLKGLTDCAILGTFTNVSGPAGGVAVYIVPDLRGPAGGAPSVPSDAILLWGPGTIGASPDSRTIGWDESAALFNADGKKLMISEVKGDGDFTLYITGTAGTYHIRVDEGVLVLTLDTGD